MAKVMVEFDTVEKTMSVKIGDKAVENVNSIYMYPSYDKKSEYSMELSMMTSSEEDDMHEMTRICASENIVLKQEQSQEKVVAKLSKVLFNKRNS